MGRATINTVTGKTATGEAIQVVTTLEEARREKGEEIKEEAYGRIVSILPEYKQRNYTARSAELLEKKIDGTISQSEIDELTVMKAIWGEIKAVRDESNTLDAAVLAATTVDEVNQITWEES